MASTAFAPMNPIARPGPSAPIAIASDVAKSLIVLASIVILKI
jgi:hypothetical protein